MNPPTFTRLGGSLGIDFVNTVQYHRDQVVNLLDTPDAVRRWVEFMSHTGRLHTVSWDALTPGPWPIERLIEFRRDVRRFLDGKTDRQTFLGRLAEAVLEVPLSFRAVPDGDHMTLVAIPSRPGSSGLLSLVAFDWLNLVVKGVMTEVTRCANHPCLAYFLDRRGRRKWCSMDTCGNRQKNARHYARQSGSAYRKLGGHAP